MYGRHRSFLRPATRVSGLLAAALALLLPFRASSEPETVWTLEDCSACHEEQVEAFARAPHSTLDRDGHAGRAGTTLSCIACHGDPTAHVDSGGDAAIFAFHDDALPQARTERCQTCHGDSHPRFQASRHAAAGLACTSCHRIHEAPGDAAADSHRDPGHGSLFALGRISQTCEQCHADVVTSFAFTERHRLREGILDCTSCHDPHEPSPRLALGGFKERQCAGCHTDKTGPFIFEHAASRVEGCIACHTPHGSPNRHLLHFQRVAEQCYSCHGVVPGFHTRFNVETQCTNCHSSIHGSNFDRAFLK